MSFKAFFTGGGVALIQADGFVDAATQAERQAVAATAELQRTERGRSILATRGGAVTVLSIQVES